jgi:hypothetical protein
MNVQQLVEWQLEVETEVLGENLPQPHMTWPLTLENIYLWFYYIRAVTSQNPINLELLSPPYQRQMIAELYYKWLLIGLLSDGGRDK